MLKPRVLKLFSYISLLRTSSSQNSSFINRSDSFQQQNPNNAFSEKSDSNIDTLTLQNQNFEPSKRKFTNFSIESILNSSSPQKSESTNSSKQDQSTTDKKNPKFSKFWIIKNTQPNTGTSESENNNVIGSQDLVNDQTVSQNHSVSADQNIQNLSEHSLDNQQSKPCTSKNSDEIGAVSLTKNGEIENIKTKSRIHKAVVTQIYSDIAEFIAMLIYFRNELNQFMNTYFDPSNQTLSLDLKLSQIIEKSQDYESNEFFEVELGKIRKSIMLFVHITFKFLKNNERYIKSQTGYQSLNCNLYLRRKRVKKLQKELVNGNLMLIQRSKVLKKIKAEKDKIANLELQRKDFPKRSSSSLICHYLEYIVNSKRINRNFAYEWIGIFTSLDKIVCFYDQNLKEVVGSQLDKFKCPASYKRREILIKENSYIDMNSITFVILEWVFYFFSPEFQEHLAGGIQANDNSKLLSRFVALIFILINSTEISKQMISRKEILDNFILNLENEFNSSKFCNLFDNFIKDSFDKIKEHDGFIAITSKHFKQRISRGLKLKSLTNLEETIQKIILTPYKLSLPIFENTLLESNQ